MIARHSAQSKIEYHPDISDHAALREVIQGNQEMFRVIVQRYNPRLYRLGMAYLRDHATTEDAMQNTYLKAFLNLRRFSGNAAFATWLTRIMINECLMILRSRKRAATEPLADESDRADPNPAVAPTATIYIAEMKAILERAVQRIPRQHRIVYLMREVDHLSTEATARCLGLTPANVKVSLHRARKELKTELLKDASGIELYDYPDTYCGPMTDKVMRSITALSQA